MSAGDSDAAKSKKKWWVGRGRDMLSSIQNLYDVPKVDLIQQWCSCGILTELSHGMRDIGTEKHETYWKAWEKFKYTDQKKQNQTDANTVKP